MKCISKELLTKEYVLYTDGDIVFNNSYVIKYLIENIKDKDILFQKKCNNILKLCSGFMFIRAKERTKDLFNTQNININEFIADEKYINQNADLKLVIISPLIVSNEKLLFIEKLFLNHSAHNLTLTFLKVISNN